MGRQLRVNQPNQDCDGGGASNYPLPAVTANESSSFGQAPGGFRDLRPVSVNYWHTGKIEPIMIKPRFSIWKMSALAAATVGFGTWQSFAPGDPAAGAGADRGAAGARGERDLIERTL